MAREINRRYGKRLRRPVQVRNVATALRRMAATGRIRQIQEGRAYHEALYARWPGGGGGVSLSPSARSLIRLRPGG